jgi:hypothetical protein
MEAITVRPSLAKFLKVDTTKNAAALHHPKEKIKIPFQHSLNLRP